MARRRDATSPLHPFPTAPSLLRYFVPSYLRTFVRQNTPATNRQFSPSPPCTPTPSALRRGQQTNLPLLRWFDAPSTTLWVVPLPGSGRFIGKDAIPIRPKALILKG